MIKIIEELKSENNSYRNKINRLNELKNQIEVIDNSKPLEKTKLKNKIKKKYMKKLQRRGTFHQMMKKN